MREYFNFDKKSEVKDWLYKNRDVSKVIESFERYFNIYLDGSNPELDEFDPCSFLSRDLTSIFYDGCPVIFEGTNSWSMKKYLNFSALINSLEKACAQVQYLSNEIRADEFCFVVVPEKDVLISKLRCESNVFENINIFIDKLSEFCKSKGFHFNYTTSISYADCISDFMYPDSHPPHSYYEVLFNNILFTLGLSASFERKIGSHFYYGDLANKFSTSLPQPYEINVLEFESSTPLLIDGTAIFVEPLNSIEQSFVNDNPIFDKSVLVLGDSHSSLYSQKRLVYLFANAFKQVDFKWKPFGYGINSTNKKYDYVILESSLRFLL